MPKNDEMTYQTAMAAAHIRGRELATEIFKIEKPDVDLINDMFVYVILGCLDGRDKVNEKNLEQQVLALNQARVWAQEVYQDDGPKATFEAMIAMGMVEDEEEEEGDEE